MAVRTDLVMGTRVTIDVIRAAADEAIERAFGWFREIEERCTRFDERSELMQLTRRAGVPVEVSAILFEAVQFAVSLAAETSGAFDPTVGRRMELRGFNREYQSGALIETPIAPDSPVTFRDVLLDPQHKTITLVRPLVLDLGAVAKGLAVDMAAMELQSFENFTIDAGGDLYLGGTNPQNEPWRVGIRHPRAANEMIDTLRVSDQAVCTSGDYERGPHILDPRNDVRGPADTIASVTVVAPRAMLADALSTAAFVLGPSEGLALLERMGVEGLIVTADLEKHATRGLPLAA